MLRERCAWTYVTNDSSVFTEDYHSIPWPSKKPQALHAGYPGPSSVHGGLRIDNYDGMAVAVMATRVVAPNEPEPSQHIMVRDAGDMRGIFALVELAVIVFESTRSESKACGVVQFLQVQEGETETAIRRCRATLYPDSGTCLKIKFQRYMYSGRALDVHFNDHWHTSLSAAKGGQVMRPKASGLFVGRRVFCFYPSTIPYLVLDAENL
ncbi:hypothetical protein EDC04DRAFT_2969800 [Pisolithus marmoratus]|nr:hypothetical protein EDC04DRAFT_2969800 [Pisolithus marmoratus]